MAKSQTITIVGDKEVVARLTAMGAKAQPALVNAIKAGALIVQNDAKVRAPYKTGNLRRSIHLEQLPANGGIAIGTNLVYAATQEYGRPGGGWNGSDIPAHAYLRPAWDQNIGRVAQTIGATLRKLIQP